MATSEAPPTAAAVNSSSAGLAPEAPPISASTDSAPPPSLSSLPPELKVSIIEAAAEDDNHDDVAALYAVNREFHRLATPIRWRAPRLNRASIESLRTIAEALSTRHAEHVKTLNFRVHERPDTQQEQQLIFASLLNICLNVECLSLPSPFNLPSPDLVAVAATRTWPRLRTLSVTSCPDCPRTMNVASLLERAVGVTAVCLVLVGQGATEVEEARLSLAITGLQNLKSFVLDCSPTKVLFGVLPSLASLRTLMVTNCEPSASAVMSALGVVHGTLTELVLHDHDVLSYTLPAGATIFLPALVELSLNRAHLSLLAILDAPSLTVVELCNSSGERVMPPLFNDLLRAQPRPSLKTISFTEGFFDRGIYYKESGQAWQAQVEEWREMGFQILIFDDNGQSSTDAPA